MPCLPTVDHRALELSSALRVHRFSRRKSVHLLALLATVLPVTIHAAVTNYVWDGNAPFATGSSRWSRASNWDPTNTAPPANTIRGLTNTDITFAGTLKTSPQLDNDYYIRSLIFAPSAGAFSLVPRAAQTLTIGAGGIVNNSTNIESIFTSLVLSNSQTCNAAAGTLAIRGTLNLGANNLTITGPGVVNINNTIQGAGTLFKQGAGNLILATANTFSGGLNLQAGSVTISNATALGTGPLTLSGGTLNLGNYTVSPSAFSLLGGVITGSGGISSSAAYQIQAGTVNSRLAGTGSLLKTTSGIATLTASNTYTGGTRITGGTLYVNNTTGSGTGPGYVSVSNGGLLAGTGFITGPVTNALGGTISAGSEIGVLNLGNSVMLGGSTLRWDLSNATGTAGTGWDLLNINGTLTLNISASNPAFLDIVSFTLGGVQGLAANFNPNQNYLWTILQTTGGINFLPGEN